MELLWVIFPTQFIVIGVPTVPQNATEKKLYARGWIDTVHFMKKLN